MWSAQNRFESFRSLSIMKRPSFTLLELLLVLALISAISSLGVAGYKRQYERSRFKSGVVGIQIDLNRTRLLAMRSGQSYIFRFVPGTGFYEIAPLETLQEAIYRMTDDASSQSDALGGSLYSDDEAAFATSLNPYSFDATNELGVESASDDLFSRENVLADLEQAGRAPSNGVVGANASPLGGSLTSAGAYGSEMGGDLGYLSGVASDGLGTGGQFAFDATGAFNTFADADQLESITIREMNSEERQIGATPNTLAWRVNLDGLIVRKEAEGGVVFTFSRLSDSTPTNLQKKRPRGADDAQSAQGAFADSVGEDLGSRLGGSLSSPPTSVDAFGNASYDENADDATRSSLWSEPIIFFPNGRTSTVVVGLASVGKYSYYSEIGVRGMTGYARISAISSVPAGSFPDESVLTEEQYFRLANPGVANPETTTEIAGGALGGDANAFSDAFDPGGGALGLEQNAAPVDDGFSALDAAANSGFTPNYGSSERRSGYSFGNGSEPSLGLGAGGLDAGNDAPDASAFNAVDLGLGASPTPRNASGLGGDATNGGFPSGDDSLGLGSVQTATPTTPTQNANGAGTNGAGTNGERRRRGGDAGGGE